MAIQATSRVRRTRLKEIAAGSERPSARKVATNPPSRTPRLAGIRKVATRIAVPNASITVAAASYTSMPRYLRSRHVSTDLIFLATSRELKRGSIGPRSRSSQALTAAPPSAAVGVIRLKASPASREETRAEKATPARRNAKRQPSVSNTCTRTTGKQRITASRQERSATEASTTAGSFSATRTAKSTRPSPKSAKRRSFSSAFPVEQQHDTDQGERPGPDSTRHPAGGRRQPQLEPTAPAGDDRQQAQGHVGHLDQELFLQVEPGVGMREEEPTADDAQQGKDQHEPGDAEPTGANRPLEDAERDDHQHEHAVLENLGVLHAF